MTPINNENNYYPFGMLQPGRQFNSDSYRFGFNGKENDNEIKGNGNQQDYGKRIYDSRLGKFLSVDPIANSYPWLSTYQFAGNTPIWAIDLDGLEPAWQKADGTYVPASDQFYTNPPLGAVKSEEPNPDPLNPGSFMPGIGDAQDVSDTYTDFENGEYLSGTLSGLSLIPGADFVTKPLKLLIKKSDDIKDLVKYSGKVGRETVIFTKTGLRTDAKKTVDGILGDMGDKVKAVEGRVKNQQERITGLQTADGNKGWRLDFDVKKNEAHYNFWNNETGEKGRVLFEGTQEQVDDLINQLTKTYDKTTK